MFNASHMPDEYEVRFTKEEDFMAEISAMEAASHWEDHTSGDLEMEAFNGPLDILDVKAKLRNDVSDEAAYDTLEVGTRLFMSSFHGLVPLRTNALRQFMETVTAVDDKLLKYDLDNDPGYLVKLFNVAKSGKNHACRHNKVWICAGKVTACGTHAYCEMPIDELFRRVIGEVRNTFPGLTFLHGSNSFRYTKAYYEIVGESADKLRQTYEDVVANFLGGRARIIDGMTFSVSVQTSNAKDSAAYVTPVILSANGSRIPIGRALSVDHKCKGGGKKEGIEALMDIAPGVFAQFADPRSKFTEMGETIINYPRGCLLNLCSSAGLSSKLAALCADDLTAVLGTNTTCTMFDVYLSICQMTGIAEAEGYAPKDVDQIEELCARIFTWSKYRWKENDHS